MSQRGWSRAGRLAVVAMVVIGLASCEAGLKEASSNFDSTEVDGFLQRLGSLVDSGLGATERHQVSEELQSMKVDESRSLEFEVTFKGRRSPLKLTLHLDDLDAVDLHFDAVSGLADAIQAEMNKR